MPPTRSRLGVVFALFLFTGIVFAQQHTEVVKENYATTRSGIRIHYLQSGDRTSKRALVLIPAWRLPAYLWTEQLNKFAPMIRVIAVDPRSQGMSSKASEDNTPEGRARDLQDVLTGLGISEPVLVGWSQGSQDVAAYLQQFGINSVAGVVFVDSPVSAGAAEIELHPQFSKVVLSGISIYASHPEEYSEGLVRSLFKKPHPDIDVQGIVKSTLQTPTDTGVAMLVSDIFGADRRLILAKLNRPCLVIGSSESPLIDVQKEMAASIPGARFVAVEGAGHAVFIDDPERFGEALEAFLHSLPDARR